MNEVREGLSTGGWSVTAWPECAWCQLLGVASVCICPTPGVRGVCVCHSKLQAGFASEQEALGPDRSIRWVEVCMGIWGDPWAWGTHGTSVLVCVFAPSRGRAAGGGGCS